MSKPLPPDHPQAEFIGPAVQRSGHRRQFTPEEMRYNVAVSNAREARAKNAPVSTPRVSGWRRMLDLLS